MNGYKSRFGVGQTSLTNYNTYLPIFTMEISEMGLKS